MKYEQNGFDAEREHQTNVIEFARQVDAMVHHDLDDAAEQESRVHGHVLDVTFGKCRLVDFNSFAIMMIVI